jgi:hypothetical protein
VVERLGCNEFLRALWYAETWDMKTNHESEIILEVKDCDGKIVKLYLEPKKTEIEFYEYMMFCERLCALMDDPEIAKKRLR